MATTQNYQTLHGGPPPLPTTVKELLADRKMKTDRTLNDYVEEAHISLWSNQDYRDFLNAVYDEQAVEGSLSADNLMASKLIRDWSEEKGTGILKREKLATISKSLGVVLRRYGHSRRERKNMIGGTIVPDTSQNGE